MRVLPLAGNHDRQAFDCGRQELNGWLRQVARQHQEKGLSKTFDAIRDEAPTLVCGYYALALAELENQHLPNAWHKKLPRRIPQFSQLSHKVTQFAELWGGICVVTN